MLSASSSRAPAPSRAPSTQRRCARWLSAIGSTPRAPALAGQFNASGGQVVPSVVVEQLRRRRVERTTASGRSPPARSPSFAKRRECALQRGYAGGVPLGEPNRQPVDEQVHGARLIRYARCLESCARDLHHPRTEPARDACGAEGGQVRVAERGTSSGSSCRPRRATAAARLRRARQIHLDLAVQELQPGAIQRVERSGGRAREQPQARPRRRRPDACWRRLPARVGRGGPGRA